MTTEKIKLEEDHQNMIKKNDDLGKKIQRYQRIYHDVDISHIHEKITLLNTENDYYKNLSTKL